VTARRAMNASFALLQSADRRKFWFGTVLQAMTAVLDLAGVLLFGLAALLVVSSASGNPLPSQVSSKLALVGIDPSDVGRATVIVGILAGTFLLLKSIVSIFVTRGVLRFLANRGTEVSARLSSAMFSCSLTEIRRWPSQELSWALSGGVTSAVGSVLISAMTIFAELVLLVLLGLMLLLVDPLVAISAIGYFGLTGILLNRALGKWATTVATRTSETDLRSRVLIKEAVESYREVTVSNRRGLYNRRFTEIRYESAHASADNLFIGYIPKFVLEAALLLGVGVLTAVLLLTEPAISAAATLALFLAAASRVMPSILRLQAATVSMRMGAALAELTYEVAEFLKDKPASVSTNETALVIRDRIAAGCPDFVPTLELRDVSVTYPGGSEPALSHVYLAVEAGTSVALAGATGAGKSTLADVLLGMIEPDSGVVELGGLRPRAAIERWPSGIAYVPQVVAISDSTVRENVALGLPPAAVDDERVWEALERAKLADYLSTSREGLDTRVGENGVRLSGGQRQRLGIARGLYSRPKLLVLDEATSALDAETEHAISETFSSLEGEVTTVTIAHRLATIRNVHKVLYLEHGVVVASGTFAEIREAVPRFRRQAQHLGL
jgi:ATP-binding cassette, subfamily B, bacterial PglK